MLTFEQIKELIELVAQHRLSGLELERSGFRLKVDGETQVVAAAPTVVASPEVQVVPAAVATAAPAAVPVAASSPAPTPEASEDDASVLPSNAQIVNSPIVGTFYRQANPDAAPFVDEGAMVEEGQVLCIVEAMKLMNEIESDVRGEVIKIYPENAQAVEFGEPLFAILPR